MEHWAKCTAPTVCKQCGKTGVTISYVEHEGDEVTQSHNDTYHWDACEVCEKSGTKVNAELHTGFCRDVEDGVGMCISCEAEDVKIGKIEHSALRDWKSDVTGHWSTCEDCWETVKEAHDYNSDGWCWTCGWEQKDTCEVHSVYCKDQTFCYVCGATVGADDAKTVVHGDEDDWYYYYFDDTYDYFGCACGKYKEGLEGHDAYCNAPTVCLKCGRTGVTMDEVLHQGEDETHKHDSTYHWSVCEVCEKSGVKIGAELHSASCTDVKDGVGTCW